VKAAAEYLRTLPQVDAGASASTAGRTAATSPRCARAHSDLFAAGVDIHGVHGLHDRGSSSGAALASALAQATRYEQGDARRPSRLRGNRRPWSSIATWRSPALLIHGDQDRNVQFGQTVDLVQRLDAAGVPYEELVVPDDTHHWMRHSNAVRVHEATAAFFERVFKTTPQ